MCVCARAWHRLSGDNTRLRTRQTGYRKTMVHMNTYFRSGHNEADGTWDWHRRRRQSECRVRLLEEWQRAAAAAAAARNKKLHI